MRFSCYLLVFIQSVGQTISPAHVSPPQGICQFHKKCYCLGVSPGGGGGGGRWALVELTDALALSAVLVKQKCCFLIITATYNPKCKTTQECIEVGQSLTETDNFYLPTYLVGVYSKQVSCFCVNTT